MSNSTNCIYISLDYSTIFLKLIHDLNIVFLYIFRYSAFYNLFDYFYSEILFNLYKLDFLE